MNIKLQYDINYDNHLSVFKDALKIARKVFIDELDCSKSFCRKRSNKTLEEMLEMAKDRSLRHHFVFIHRDQSFLPQDFIEDGKNPNRNYWDIGFSTRVGNPDYFLFIEVEEKDGFDIVEKHNLKVK